MKILFVNACLRGGESNTLTLCRAALEALLAHHPEAEVQEVDLAALRLLPLYGEDIKRRSALHAEEAYSDAIYDCARDFAAADCILIGAPYWDLSFPAALKVYLERVCAADVTFSYTAEGKTRGLCRAQQALYITTAGTSVAGLNLGYDYVRTLAELFFGIPAVSCFSLGGFDLGGDTAALLEAGIRDLRALLAGWS